MRDISGELSEVIPKIKIKHFGFTQIFELFGFKIFGRRTKIK